MNSNTTLCIYIVFSACHASCSIMHFDNYIQLRLETGCSGAPVNRLTDGSISAK